MGYSVKQISVGAEEREEHSGQILPVPRLTCVLYEQNTWNWLRLAMHPAGLPDPSPPLLSGKLLSSCRCHPSFVASSPLFSLERMGSWRRNSALAN